MGDSTPTEAKYGGPLPLEEVGVLRLDKHQIPIFMAESCALYKKGVVPQEYYLVEQLLCLNLHIPGQACIRENCFSEERFRRMKVRAIIGVIIISMIGILAFEAFRGPIPVGSASELVQLKLNIETSVGESTSFAAKCFYWEAARRYSPLETIVTEAEYGVPLPLEEVGVSRLDEKALEEKPDQLIRFHVLANSDSEQDQALKRAVRDAILKAVAPQLAVCQSLEESRQIVKQIRPDMEAIALSVVHAWNKNYTVHTDYGRFSFPTKSYGTLVLPAGQYEALRVVIGEGQGSNWWCVLFPALCFVDIEHSIAVQVDGKTQTDYATSSTPKVRFFFWERIKGLFN